MLSNVTIPLVGAVDTAVVGRLPEVSYIGGVAIGALVFSLLYWAFGFLRMGTTGFAAQAWGAGDVGELTALTLRALALASGFGVMLIVLQAPLSELLHWMFPASAEVDAHARTYFAIRIWGAPANLIIFVLVGVLFGLQQMKTVWIILLLVNGTNIVLDFLFVLGFGWGIPGVAAATIIGEYLGAIAGLMIVHAALRRSGCALNTAAPIFDRKRLQALFGVSGNLLIRSLSLKAAFVTFTALSARSGDVVLAANAILLHFLNILSFALDGFAHAVEALAGKAFGARDPVELRDAVRYSLMLAAVAAAVIALAYYLAGPWLISLFTNKAPVRTLAESYLVWVVAAPLIAVWAYHFDGVYIGTTRTREMRNRMLISLATFFVVAVVAVPTLANHGLWLSMMVFFAVRGVTLAVGYPSILRLATGAPKDRIGSR
jgi:MATE family multidrug resistance protein